MISRRSSAPLLSNLRRACAALLALAPLGCGADFASDSALATGSKDGPGGASGGALGGGGAAGASTGGASSAGKGGAGQGFGGSAGGGPSAGKGGGGGTTAAGGGSGEELFGSDGACRACIDLLCEACEGDCGGCEENPQLCAQGSAKGQKLRQCACNAGECASACKLTPLCQNDPGGGGSSGGGGASAAGSGGASTTGGAGGSSAAGAGGSGAFETDCTDKLDNDFNGLPDCNDAACTGQCKDMCLSPPVLLPGSRAGSLAGHKDASYQPNCAAGADTGVSVAYLFQPPANGWLTVKAKSSTGDLVLSARKGPCGGAGYTLCRNQIGAGGEESLQIEVTEGQTWTLLVGGAGVADNESDFELSLTLEQPVCGDGKVSPELNEQCDDANEDPGDGCDKCSVSACQDAPAINDTAIPEIVATPAPVLKQGNTSELLGTAGSANVPSLLQPSCAQLGSSAREHVYALRAANSGRLEVSLTSQQDARDLVLSVWSLCTASGELACVDAAPGAAGAVERLSLPAEAGQAFFVVVDGASSGDEGGYELRAQTLPAACGDGVLARSVEQCDPQIDQGSCSTDCTRLVADDEPPGGLPEVIGVGERLGRIFPAGDVDTYALELPGGTPSFSVEIASPTALDDCGAGQLDSQIELLSEDGQTVVAFSDDAPGKGYCSSLSVAQATASKYLVRVKASSRYAPSQVFAYKLKISP